MPTSNEEAATTSNLELLDRYWRAANYLSVGQIYLLDNPLLREPLRPSTSSHGCSVIGAPRRDLISSTPISTARSARAISTSSMSAALAMADPAWSPTPISKARYSEIYPDIARDADGLHKLFRQFSFPGGIPSHAAPETPGSINEGGELGYALVHAYGAAFDNPDLIVRLRGRRWRGRNRSARGFLAFQQVPESGA